MTMRSALYYPHTEIRSGKLMKTALMLWDRIHVIVPFDGYVPNYQSKEAKRSFELIGNCHCPTEDEKKHTHELVEDFATRGLPESFSYFSVQSPEEIYEVYPQKLLPKTWTVLEQAGLAGKPLANADYPMANAAGLSLMSLLADCCAGDTLVRVTDRSAAYASLAGLMTESSPSPLNAMDTRESLLAETLKIADADSIPLSKWIKFREREVGAADGHQVRALRHRFVEHLEAYAGRIVGAKTGAARKEMELQFREDSRDDLRALREALKLEAGQVLSTKEIWFSALAGIAAIGSLAFSSVMPMPDVVTSTGGVASIGGLLASRYKYVSARRKVLRDHPLSYLYEAGGGLFRL